MWIAFYSGSGREIKSLSVQPDIVITDNLDADFGTYRSGNYYEGIEPTDIVTLHGWMNIVPEDVCKKLNIYNGHPGLINKYPELKGKDPQIRATKYKIIGSVIHRVTAKIDCGEIIYSLETENNGSDIFEQLRVTSLQLWENFIVDKIARTKNNGGPTSYYDLDPSWEGAGDIIEGRNMNFNQGNIFKVAFCFNVGRHNATDYERELNKIVYFANRELRRLKNGAS